MVFYNCGMVISWVFFIILQTIKFYYNRNQ